MELGIVGFGMMGGGIASRLARDGHALLAYDRDPAALATAPDTVTAAHSLAELCTRLAPPRAVWLMLPPAAVDDSLRELAGLLQPGDIVVDAGNSNPADTRARAGWLSVRGIELVDVGISGGQWGATEGCCVMAGGSPSAVDRLQPVFTSLAAPGAYVYLGASGAAHLGKEALVAVMHAMMQAYAEALDLLRASPDVTALPHAVAEAWARGGCVQSWLLDRSVEAFRSGLYGAVSRAPSAPVRARWGAMPEAAEQCADDARSLGLSPHVLAATALAYQAHRQGPELSPAACFYSATLIQTGGLRRTDALGACPEIVEAAAAAGPAGGRQEE